MKFKLALEALELRENPAGPVVDDPLAPPPPPSQPPAPIPAPQPGEPGTEIPVPKW